MSRPVTVQAAPVQSVKIGTAELDSTNKYYHNGDNGAQGEANESADGANATFDASTGTLTLNNLNITTNQPGIWWTYQYSGAHDLTIVLNNSTTNTISNSDGSGILGEIGLTNGPSLTITGSGILSVTGKTCGIWVWKNITICDSATVNATGTEKVGICNNDSDGKITVKDSAVVNATGATYGIGYDNDEIDMFNVPVIAGGTVTLTGGTAAVRVRAGYTGNSPDLESYPSNCKVTVGDAAEGSAEWKTSNPLQNYKYIKIEQANHAHSYEWKMDEDKHWQECEGYRCNASTIAEDFHVYTDDSDATCDTCGYIRVIPINSVGITITAPTGGDELATKATVSTTGVSSIKSRYYMEEWCNTGIRKGRLWYCLHCKCDACSG